MIKSKMLLHYKNIILSVLVLAFAVGVFSVFGLNGLEPNKTVSAHTSNELKAMPDVIDVIAVHSADAPYQLASTNAFYVYIRYKMADLVALGYGENSRISMCAKKGVTTEFFNTGFSYTGSLLESTEYGDYTYSMVHISSAIPNDSTDVFTGMFYVMQNMYSYTTTFARSELFQFSRNSLVTLPTMVIDGDKLLVTTPSWFPKWSLSFAQKLTPEIHSFYTTQAKFVEYSSAVTEIYYLSDLVRENGAELAKDTKIFFDVFPTIYVEYTTPVLYPLPHEPEAPEGMHFEAWYYDIYFLHPYDGLPITPATQLHAKFAPNIYDVKFYTNATLVHTSQVPHRASVSEYLNSVGGYVHSGWFIDAALSVPYSFETPVTSSMNLYSVLTVISYTVTFDGNGGQLMSGEEIQLVNSGSTGIAPSYKKTGYDFIGWDKSFNSIYQDMTVTAQWRLKQYTITFDANGGSIVPNTGSETATVFHGGLAVAPSVIREGYLFAGWSIDINNVVSEETAFAQWQPKLYNVYFIVDGEEHSSITIPHGVEFYSLPSVQTLLSIYTAIYSDEEMTEEFSNQTITGNITVYAELKSTVITPDDTDNFLTDNWIWLTASAVLFIGLIVSIGIRVRGR